MTTNKSYTDLSQSKTLSKILPLESADMSYCAIHNVGQELHHCNIPIFIYASNKDIPCWSLSALLGVLNFPSLTQENENKWGVCVFDHNNDDYIEKTASNPVDACYEMIMHLHNLKML